MKNILISVLFAVAAAYLTVLATSNSYETRVPARETVYEKVIRTGTLRCGYGIFPPLVVKDANSAEIKGIFVDLMKAIGEASNLKIEFVEEVDWGQIPQALQSGRIDAMCAGMWGTAKRGKMMAFSEPLFYSVAYPYVRPDDNRFDNNLAAINDPTIRLSVNDGDVSLDIADRWFPKAQRIYKVQMAGEDFLLMNVITGKADMTFTTPSIARAFIKNNPDSLRQVKLDKPLAINQNVIGIDVHENELQNLLNTAVKEISNNGVISKVFSTYDPDVTSDFLLALPE